jgi:OOP family OmpA-OmpF porin
MSLPRALFACATLATLSLLGAGGHAQEVEWFRSGFYLGASAGLASADVTASDVDGDLEGLGYTTDTDLDRADLGWKVFAGYRFEWPVALELAWTDLGEVESTIDASPPDVQAFVDDVARIHPFSGEGVSLALEVLPLDTERVSLGIKGGGWYWMADLDVKAASGERIGIDEDGFDPLVGAVLHVRLTSELSLRAEWERFFLPENDVDLFSLGLQYRIY